MIGPQKAPAWRPLGRPGVHYWLVQRMAKTCGVDTAQAAQSGALDPETWVEMVTGCRSCTWVDGCDRWLKAHVDDPTAAPPVECRNADGLIRLAERQDP
jgi:hypothetical protein